MPVLPYGAIAANPNITRAAIIASPAKFRLADAVSSRFLRASASGPVNLRTFTHEFGPSAKLGGRQARQKPPPAMAVPQDRQLAAGLASKGRLACNMILS